MNARNPLLGRLPPKAGSGSKARCHLLTHGVILLYLGFRNAGEMATGKQRPLADHAEWKRLVLAHSAPLFLGEVWDREWKTHGQSFIPLIGSTTQSIDAPTSAATP